jgi:hypothetical protein
MFRPGHRRAATSCAPARFAPCPHAGRPRRTHHASPKATHRPRRAPSTCVAPRGSSESSWGLAHRAAPYRPRARRGPSVHRRHTTKRAPVEVAVLCRHLSRRSDVTGGLAYKNRAPRPPRAITAAHRARHCHPPVNSPPRPCPVHLTFLAYSLGALGTCATTRCSALHLPSRSRIPPQPPPLAVAAHPHWSRPRSYPGLPRALGEHVVMPHLSYGPPWAHYLGGFQDRLLGGPLGLPGLRCTVPGGVEHKDYRGEVLG